MFWTVRARLLTTGRHWTQRPEVNQQIFRFKKKVLGCVPGVEQLVSRHNIPDSSIPTTNSSHCIKKKFENLCLGTIACKTEMTWPEIQSPMPSS